jgi:hypothetical protein
LLWVEALIWPKPVSLMVWAVGGQQAQNGSDRIDATRHKYLYFPISKNRSSFDGNNRLRCVLGEPADYAD